MKLKEEEEKENLNDDDFVSVYGGRRATSAEVELSVTPIQLVSDLTYNMLLQRKWIELVNKFLLPVNIRNLVLVSLHLNFYMKFGFSLPRKKELQILVPIRLLTSAMHKYSRL